MAQQVTDALLRRYVVDFVVTTRSNDFFGALVKPGVSFTAEQEQAIRDLVQAGEIAAAQQIILDKLGKG